MKRLKLENGLYIPVLGGRPIRKPLTNYIFVHMGFDGKSFMVRAKTKRLAIKKFVKKVRGKYGFFPDMNISDANYDLREGNLEVYKPKKI